MPRDIRAVSREHHVLLTARIWKMFGRFAMSFVLASLCGCSGGYSTTADIEKVVPVSGTLTYKGKPLESYQVVFMPSDGRRVATGVADAQGNFKMGTNDAGDGAPPGQCKVAVVFAPPETGEGGNEQIIDNPAMLPKPKVQIPKKYSNPETSGLTQDIPEAGISGLKIDLQ